MNYNYEEVLKRIIDSDYEKERIFEQDNGTWYDREEQEYLTKEEFAELAWRIYELSV